MLDKQDFYALKKSHKPIAMLTAYDAPFARMAEAAGIDTLLVGDSGANVVLGYASTRDIGMDEMVLFTAAVRRGAPNTHVVADMPYGSDREPAQALINAQRLIDAGANAVKIEGCLLTIVSHLRNNNIEVVGHLGLLPQTAVSFKQQGNTPEDAKRIMEEALALDGLDLCALVLEHVPESLGSLISQGVQAPVIGIGAGKQVDGQVLVLHDALGMHPFKIPPFASRFSNLWEHGITGMRTFAEAVRERRC